VEPRLDGGRGVLRDLRPELFGLRRGRKGRPERARLPTRLFERRQSGHDRRSRGGRRLAHAGLPIAELPRLRHDGLRDHQSRLRLQRGLRSLPRGGAPPRHPRDSRLRDEPHGRRPPVVRRFELRPGFGEAGLVRLEPDRPRLDAAVGEQPDLAPEERRVLLRHLLERHAGPELPHARGPRGDRTPRAPLAGPRRGRIPAGCNPAPRRDGPRAGSVGHAGDPRVPEGVRGVDPRCAPLRDAGGGELDRDSDHRRTTGRPRRSREATSCP